MQLAPYSVPPACIWQEGVRAVHLFAIPNAADLTNCTQQARTAPSDCGVSAAGVCARAAGASKTRHGGEGHEAQT